LFPECVTQPHARSSSSRGIDQPTDRTVYI
jgi:hypothetical protein